MKKPEWQNELENGLKSWIAHHPEFRRDAGKQGDLAVANVIRGMKRLQKMGVRWVNDVAHSNWVHGGDSAIRATLGIISTNKTEGKDLGEISDIIPLEYHLWLVTAKFFQHHQQYGMV